MKELEARKQSELMSSQQLKKMIPQLLLSVSLFSFVFSYSSFYSSSSPLLYSSKFHYFHFLSHALNKNCLFLICNGLLVFLAKSSGFIRPPSEHHDLDDRSLHKRIIGDDMIEKFAVEESVGDSEITEEKEEEEEMVKSESPEEVAIFTAESEEEGGGEGCNDLEKEENDLQAAESRRCWLFNDDDDDEELEDDDDDEGEREEMSTEELNQKFEDFIRRMKKEIVINEARQRSMVMVN